MDIAGHVSESLESTWWEMGIPHPADWTAKWIAWKNPEDQADRKGIRWIWVKGQDALAAVPKTSATFRVNKSREMQCYCSQCAAISPPR